MVLGLPGGTAGAESAGDKPGDGGDATASTAADLVFEPGQPVPTASEDVFKLPAALAPSDNVIGQAALLMTPDGRLAAEPTLIEASASTKGAGSDAERDQRAQACQPYAMLPKDRYGEWKVLDLTFTPQDFARKAP